MAMQNLTPHVRPAKAVRAIPALTVVATKAVDMAERYGDDCEASEVQALINDIRHLTGMEA